MTPLAYAQLGLAVFPCYYAVVNGTTRCSCGDVNCGSSAAKHPYPRLASNGFKSASKDPRIIGRWCSGPYNVAIATGAVSGVIVLYENIDRGFQLLLIDDGGGLIIVEEIVDFEVAEWPCGLVNAALAERAKREAQS